MELATVDARTLQSFATALLIGALVGIEREQRKPGQGASAIPGVRTFMLLALVGALAAWLSRLSMNRCEDPTLNSQLAPC